MNREKNSSILNSINFRIIYRFIYIIMLAAGIIANIMLYIGKTYHEEFVYYTLQSNIICLVIMTLMFIDNIKGFKNGERQGRQKRYITAQYAACIWILITCLIYNVLLGNPFTSDYWTGSIHNPILHMFGPIMFILDFYLFAEHGKIAKWTPALSVVYPYVYIPYIFIRSAVLNNIFDGKIPEVFVVYPYFFFDVDKLGVGGVVWWIVKLTVIFVALGVVMFGLDRIIDRKISKR